MQELTINVGSLKGEGFAVDSVSAVRAVSINPSATASTAVTWNEKRRRKLISNEIDKPSHMYI